MKDKSRKLRLNWIPVAFSGDSVQIYHWPSEEKKGLMKDRDSIGTAKEVDFKEYKGVQAKLAPEQVEQTSGVFYFGSKSALEAVPGRVEVLIGRFRNHHLIKQFILGALGRAFRFDSEYHFTRNYFLSTVVIRSSEVAIVPEFSVYERIQLKPYYFRGLQQRDKPTYGLILKPSHQYIFEISASDLPLFENGLVGASTENGYTKGKLRAVSGPEAVIEDERDGSEIARVSVQQVTPAGTVSNFRKLCRAKYSDQADQFMQRLREASGSATRGSQINENRLRDKFHSVKEFVESIDNRFGDFKLYDESETVFTIKKQFLPVDGSSESAVTGGRLPRRKFKFGSEKGRNATSKIGQYKGVKSRGVVEGVGREEELEFLFVFPDGQNHLANRLYFALKNGLGPFPGIESFFDIPLNIDNVRSIAVPTNYSKGWRRVSADYHACLTEELDNLADEPKKRLAFLIAPESRPSDFPNPHYLSKALLLKHGIPSQGVDQETIQNEGTLKWSVANIALAVFSKLGGVPWEVESRGDGHQLVFGVGKKNMFDRDTGELRRIVGYTVCVTEEGRFQSSTTGTPYKSWREFNDHFPGRLAKAIRDNILPDTEEIVIHFPDHMGATLAGKIESVLDDVADEMGRYYPYAVIRVTDSHDYILWDTSHKTYFPKEGRYAKIDRDNALLMVPGRQSKRSMLTVPGQPLQLTVEHSSLPSTNLDDVLHQAYTLAGANWHAFNAREMPITREYSELIAQELGNMDEYDIDYYEGLDQLSEVPWFL